MTSSHHRYFALFGISVVAAAGLSACSNNWGDVKDPEHTPATADMGSTDNPVDVAVWYTTGTGGKESAQAFHADHPTINVTAATAPSDTPVTEAINAAINKGDAPCLAQVPYQDISTLLNKEQLLDVTEQASQYKKTYAKGPWGQVTLADKTYGLPTDADPLVYLYNSKAFDSLNLKAPASWDDYFDTAKKAHAEGKYASAVFKDHAADLIGGVVAANGAEWFALDGAAWRIHMDSDTSKHVTKKWQDSIDDGATMVTDLDGDDNSVISAVKDGSLIGFVVPASAATALSGALGADADQWQVAQLPGDKTGPWGGSALVVLSTCGYPEAALEYANYYNTNLLGLTDEGLVPAANNDLKTPAKLQALFGTQNVAAEFHTAADNSNPSWQYIPTWDKVAADIDDHVASNDSLEDVVASASEVAKSSLEDEGIAIAKF